MNELVANHQNIISQKDKQLAEFQKQVDSLHKAESDLTKQIEEQKIKNNVSWESTIRIRTSFPSWSKFCFFDDLFISSFFSL